MKTETEIEAETTDSTEHRDERPTLSLNRVIEIAPSALAFGGWGPKVNSGIIKIWN